MRPIDADALREKIDNIWKGRPLSTLGARILVTIDEALTIDAVEVVRCKECRYFKKIVKRSDSGLCYRDLVASAWKENGYCSRGERKGGDTE